MKRFEVESRRDAIKSGYSIIIDYDELEQELIRDLEYGYIAEEEFEEKLNKLYSELEKEQML